MGNLQSNAYYLAKKKGEVSTPRHYHRRHRRRGQKTVAMNV